MDKFVTITKPSYLRNHKKRANSPYDEGQLINRAEIKPSSSALTKHLLSTLTDKTNPITHSDIGKRTDNIFSVATGHQVSERRARPRYLQDQDTKLTGHKEERPVAETNGILRNVRVYINGYLHDTTDIEMKRIVRLAGGLIMPSAAGATHILTSQQLSSSKTHRILTSKCRKSVHVVHPEWVTDSVKAGKRQSERHYSVIAVTNTIN